MHLVYVLLMWLLFHFVLFCLYLFPFSVLPSVVLGLRFASQAPASVGVELAWEGRELSFPASSCRLALSSPVPSSPLFPVQPLPLP